MKKRTFAALLLSAALLLCAACGPAGAENTSGPTPESPSNPTPTAAPSPSPTPTEAPPSAEPSTVYGTPIPVGFAFTRENMPRLDGSDDLAELAEGVCAAVLRENREEVTDLVRFNKTTTAYYNLLWGYADLLMVGDCDENVLEEKESRAFDWEKEPFAWDALLFVVPADSPVESITVEQARQIYAGELTVWTVSKKEELELVPFRRADKTEADALLEDLVMAGTDLAEFPEERTVSAVQALAEAMTGEGAPAGAVGCCTWQEWRALSQAEGLKLLAVNGTAPDEGTIRAGKYPLCSAKYVVISAGAAEEDPSRLLFDWLLSGEGQRLVRAEGYVPVTAVAEEAPEA